MLRKETLIQQDFLKNLYSAGDISLLSECTLCPRECRVNRFEGSGGFCRSDAGLNISSICIHRGEEPAISGPSGICNIFFSGCNLKCIYCQNNEISRNGASSQFNSNQFFIRTLCLIFCLHRNNKVPNIAIIVKHFFYITL